MKVLGGHPTGPINTAQSDDGRVIYSPAAKYRLMDVVDGRDMVRGNYVDPNTGRNNGGQVSHEVWRTAIELMRDVNEHNDAIEVVRLRTSTAALAAAR